MIKEIITDEQFAEIGFVPSGTLKFKHSKKYEKALEKGNKGRLEISYILSIHAVSLQFVFETAPRYSDLITGQEVYNFQELKLLLERNYTIKNYFEDVLVSKDLNPA